MLSLQSLALLVAAAMMMPAMVGAESAGASTTTIHLMERLITENMTLLEGSVISADATATTLELDCQASVYSICTSSGILWPQTVTVGPSIQGMNFDITTYYGSTLWIVSASASCVVTNSSMGADCVLTTSSWHSAGTTISPSTVDGVTVTVGPTLAFATIPVVSGLDKLALATTNDASPASTATPTSAPNTAAATATNISSTSSSSSSIAWIAGPVVGAIAGIALVGALTIWYFRRARKNTGDAEGVTFAGAGGAADWDRRRELQGTYEPPELHSNASPSELHADAAKVELPVTQFDFDTKKQRETQNMAHEMP